MKSLIKVMLINLVGLSMLNIIVNIVLPNGNFKKYARLMIGMVMLVVILKLFINTNDSALLDQSIYESYNEMSLEALETRGQSIDRAQERQIEKLFKERIESQIKMQVENIIQHEDIVATVELDQMHDNTYDIARIYIRSENISYGNILSEEKASEYENKIDSAVEYLSTLYNIPKENIAIEING